MYRSISFLVGAFVLFILVACNQVVTSTSPRQDPIPTPAQGKSTFSGRVLSKSDQSPIKTTVVRLAAVHHDSATQQSVYALDLAHSPGTATDAQGYFTFTDLAPGEYVLVVGDYYGTNDIVREDNGDARVYKIEAGKTHDTGTVQVRPDVSPG